MFIFCEDDSAKSIMQKCQIITLTLIRGNYYVLCACFFSWFILGEEEF